MSWAVSAFTSVTFSTNCAPTEYQCAKYKVSDCIQGAKLHTDSESKIFKDYIHGMRNILVL